MGVGGRGMLRWFGRNIFLLKSLIHLYLIISLSCVEAKQICKTIADQTGAFMHTGKCVQLDLNLSNRGILLVVIPVLLLTMLSKINRKANNQEFIQSDPKFNA